MKKAFERTRPGLRLIAVLAVFFSVAGCSTSTHTRTDDDIAKPMAGDLAGKGRFEFSDWAGPALTVWTYVPPNAGSNAPIVFIMHGNKREPERYQDEWVTIAEANGLVLVAPTFSEGQFPGARSYNLGGIFDEDGGITSKDRWAYSAIEPIFDAVKRRTENRQNRYAIYGHSAGAQFVHRFLYFVPDARVSQAIAANAGWYTMPSFEVPFPYGLKGAPATQVDLRGTLGQKLVVLLGTEDNDPQHNSLRRTPEANAQGAHRFARGQTFFRIGAAEARKLDTDFGWQLAHAPGVGHKNGLMAPFAAQILVPSSQPLPAAAEKGAGYN